MVGEVLAVIRSLAREGMTMLIVTHEMQFARDVSTRVFYMDEGVIYEDGKPEQIFEQPQREKTRQFVQRLKVLEEKIIPGQVDYSALNDHMTQFCQRNGLSSRTICRLQLVLEEMLNSLLLPCLTENDRLRVTVEYSEKNGTLEIRLCYSGQTIQPDHMDEIFDRVISSSAENIEYLDQDDPEYPHLIRIAMKM